MLYFKYRTFIKVFKYIKKRGNTEHLDWILEEKYGKVAEEALSILMARGGVSKHFMSSFYEPHSAKLDEIILEYEDKCSSMFWEFVKWTIGTVIAVVGLYIAYLSFVK